VAFGYAVVFLKWWVLETWGACSHKKIVAASAVTAFWNLSTLKTRIFTGNLQTILLSFSKLIDFNVHTL
jgi:hypothetical protein